MSKPADYKYIDEFHKTWDHLREERRQIIEQIERVYNEMLERAKVEDIPDFVWSGIALNFFLSNRYEQALEAQLKAVEEGERLNGEERKVLSAIYGDLAMIYEHMDKYDKAVDAHRKGLEIKMQFYGEEDESVMRAKKRLERAEKIAKVLED